MTRFFLRRDSAFWRTLASFGADRAPRSLLRYSPPAWALAFALALPDVRARVRANLRRAVGRRPRYTEMVDVVRTFSHFASCLTEALAMGGPHAEPIDCTVDGGEYLERAVERKRGVVLVTAHTGGWEVVAAVLKNRFDVDIMVAMQREPNARARRIQDRARERSGIKVAHVGREPLAALPLFTHLRRGGALGLQIDRTPSEMRSLPVQLFGASGVVPSGPFELARATGAPIVPVFIRRLGYFRYAIHVCPIIDVLRGARAGEVRAAAQLAAGEMERFIRAHPTDWFDFGSDSSSGLPAAELSIAT